LPGLRNVSGEETVKILCNKFGFIVSGQSGSHVRLSKTTQQGKVGTVVPMHPDLKIGTLKSVLKLARISSEEFAEYL
jgi:predicted RNA binding protein YcfA (HicA-like mRNA interferase family)